MPPRKATPAVAGAVAQAKADFIGDDPNVEGYIGTLHEVEVDSPYTQEPRTVRANHTLKTTNISKSGNTPIYRFGDVLNFAYTQGFLGFDTPSVEFHPGMGSKGGPLCVVTAIGKFTNADGSVSYVSAIGDASPENCGSLVAPHYPRMAETRAQGRVLNRALNLNAVMAEELFEDDAPVTQQIVHNSVINTRVPAVANNGFSGLTKSAKAELPEYWPPFNNVDGDGFSCVTCEKEVKGKSAFWSVDKTGEVYCWEHQQEAMKK